MENEERVICLCRECKGERYVSQRTARRHSSLKRKIDDDQGEVPNRPSLESNIFNGSDHTLKQAIAMVMKIYSDFPQVSTYHGELLFPYLNILAISEVSQAAITSFLQVLKELLPAGHLVPESYRAAHTMIKSQLTPVQEFHVCPNDHVIFTGELSNVENCPTCGTCRYNSDGTPVKKFQYLPLIPRLQRWSLVPKLRDLLRTHIPDHAGAANSMVTDITQSQIWDTLLPGDDSDDFQLGFALSIDGIGPYNAQHNTYSMTPVLLSILNLPAELRKAAPKDINPYLHPLVEDLDEGILIDDKEATTPATTLKGRLMVGIYDTPGRAKVTKAVGGNSKKHACWQCDQEGSRKEVAELQKQTGRKGKEKLAELPYYEDVAAPLEPMHTIQVVVKKVISLLTEHQSAKMIKAKGKRRKISKEVPVVHLTKEERRVADTRILNIRTPKHLVFNPKPFFSSYVYMRSADYRKLATEGILKYALRGMLGERQRKTLFALCDSIRDLCSGKCDDETIDAMDTKLQEVLARVERDFPLGLQVNDVKN
nr:uncharacterized protein LOC129283892 [Lytechinus pictus]